MRQADWLGPTQKQPGGTDSSIKYWYRSLNNGKGAYDMTNCECNSMGSISAPALHGGISAHRPPGHNALKWIVNLTDSTEKLVRWRLRLLELELDIVHYTGIKHQTADVLLPLRNTRTDQTPIGDEIQVLCITSSISQKGEAKVMYMKDYHALNDNEGIGRPAVYNIGT